MSEHRFPEMQPPDAPPRPAPRPLAPPPAPGSPPPPPTVGQQVLSGVLKVMLWCVMGIGALMLAGLGFVLLAFGACVLGIR